MMENTQVVKVQQFDGTNFGNWKYRLGTPLPTYLLDEKSLRKFIEKDFAENLSGISASEQNTIGIEEKKCMSGLVQTIHDNQLENVMEKKTAKEMFDALCCIYERKSITSHQLLLRKKLFIMKYNENDYILEHFLQFDKVVRELKSTGAKMEKSRHSRASLNATEKL